MDQRHHRAASDSFQEDFHDAVRSIAWVIPCEPQPLVGDNVKESPLVSVLIAVASSHPEVYPHTLCEPRIELTWLRNCTEDSAWC